MRPFHQVFALAMLSLAAVPACDDRDCIQDDTNDGDPVDEAEWAVKPDAPVAAACSAMSLGQLANTNGFVPFSSTSLWNTDISTAPVDPRSANIINFIGPTIGLHADFGAGTFNGSTIGIPYQIVPGSQAKVALLPGAFADESDPGPMPIPSNALIEGYPNPDGGDRHVLVLDKDNCFLYELFNAFTSAGTWSADASAVWDMTIDSKRPYTWTSADAAGLPIFAGLARFDEVASGAINHALRFTVPNTRRAFVAPASHWASTSTNPNAPPMGTRLRLRASFDISPFGPQAQVILTALKNYGMILADNGSAVFISGAPSQSWNNDDIGGLRSVTANNFDVVQMGTVITDSNVPTGPVPTISSFAASRTTVRRGNPVTLTWSVSDAIYDIISPEVGAVRGTSVVVTPTRTTTYTLYATNQYGRTTRSVTITVQKGGSPH